MLREAGPNQVSLAEDRAHCELLRDIVRDPFPLVAAAHAWLTWRDATIPKLAQAAYDERELPSGQLDAKRLAILADALEEAGCTNEDVLAHLRGPGPHVRGCWVVDCCWARSKGTDAMAKPKFKSPLAAAWEEMDRKVQAERAARGPSKPRKAPKHIDDPVFGELTLVGSDLYERDLELKLFGKKFRVRLQVNICPQNGLEDRQLRAFEQYRQSTARMLAEAEKKVLAYYQAVCEDYRDDLGITAARDKRVPLIKTVAELARLVKPEALYFPYLRPRPTCGLLCQCTWETEHGLAVKFVNGKVTEVGFQDIVL